MGLDKFIPEPMRWFEIDSHEMALQLLIKGVTATT